MQIHRLSRRLDGVPANSCLAGLGTAKEEINAKIPNLGPLRRLGDWNGDRVGFIPWCFILWLYGFNFRHLLDCDQKGCCLDFECGWRT